MTTPLTDPAGPRPAVAVRPVRDEEHDVVADLTARAYRDVLGGQLRAEYEAELRRVPERAREALVLVAEADSAVVGAVTYVPDATNPWAEWTDRDAAGIRMLAVEPCRQGRGVGEALVRAAITRARAAGRRRLLLHSTPEMTVAQRLYERLGFVRDPALDWRPEPAVSLRGYRLDLDWAAR